jgi:methyl-accepting chemotaxis protein
MKLLVSFGLVIVLSVIVGAVGIIGMLQLDAKYTDMYDYNLIPLPSMSNVTTKYQQIRINLREFTIGAYADNAQQVENAHTAIQGLMTDITADLDAYQALISNPEVETLFTDARTRYDQEFKPFVERLYQAAKGFDEVQVLAISAEGGAMITFVGDNFAKCMDIEVTDAAAVSDANTVLAQTMLIVIIAVLAAAVVIAVFLALYISGLISKPLAPLTAFMRQAASPGRIRPRQEDIQTLAKYGNQKDELGQTIAATDVFLKRINEVSKALETVADGDLTASFSPLSGEDTLGLSLQKMTENLNAMFADINNSSEQVSSGSKQIADGAQALAQGSTQQAAAVEQLSSSIAEIADKTKENAAMADKAAALSESIRHNAEKGSNQMGQMTQAVKEINEASQAISKVIKTIDDIAFQTNILALNAAVEAARAGQHGKGFAVVAEEVRSLASKSAAAAKDTAELIENSMEKAGLGAKIAGETAASLGEIVSGINESSVLVGDIAKSSEEQSRGIAQINKGIDQVAQVVQQNSATAEESAAAAQEMSSQSNMLEELIQQFKFKDSNARKTLSAPAQTAKALGGYGKY